MIFWLLLFVFESMGLDIIILSCNAYSKAYYQRLLNERKELDNDIKLFKEKAKQKAIKWWKDNKVTN